MDEIFERIKGIKVKHKILVFSLAITEIIGIFTLVWYLRTSLIERYFTSPPKSFAIESFDPKKRYLIQQGDFLRGKNALPNSKVLAIITPGKQTVTVKADKNGEFIVKLPPDAKTGRHRVTFANYDALKNLAWTKSYKLTVNSNNTLSNNKLVQRLKLN